MSTEIMGLSHEESVRLQSLEQTIEHGLQTFVEVGTALMEIRDSRLYRETHSSFEDYCRRRWGWSRIQAHRQIAAAEVCQNIMSGQNGLNLLPMGNTPANERQARPLTALPADEQADAWQEAVAESNGKPTAAVVQAVVDRKLGKTTINGKHVEDTPEIASARANGRIPEAADVEIIDPGFDEAPAESVREEYAERQAIQEEVSDEDWVATLPLFTLLEGVCRDRFVEDAILYRVLTPARKTFAHHATRAFNKVRRKGAYAFRLQSFLGVSAPDQWLLCPTVENGGCGGTGEVKLIGRCPKCHGRGYWIK